MLVLTGIHLKINLYTGNFPLEFFKFLFVKNFFIIIRYDLNKPGKVFVEIIQDHLCFFALCKLIMASDKTGKFMDISVIFNK